MSFSEQQQPTTVRERVTPIAPKAPLSTVTPLPIDAVRAAVRAEMETAMQTLARDTAGAYAGAREASLHAVLRSIATLLAVRFLLMLALIGGFVIAIMALRDGSYQADGILIAYACLIVIPIIWLERQPRQGP